MKKTKLEERREFIHQAVHSPEITAKSIAKQLSRLKRMSGTSGRVELLAELLYLSEGTIWKDLENFAEERLE